MRGCLLNFSSLKRAFKNVHYKLRRKWSHRGKSDNFYLFLLRGVRDFLFYYNFQYRVIIETYGFSLRYTTFNVQNNISQPLKETERTEILVRFKDPPLAILKQTIVVAQNEDVNKNKQYEIWTMENGQWNIAYIIIKAISKLGLGRSICSVVYHLCIHMSSLDSWQFHGYIVVIPLPLRFSVLSLFPTRFPYIYGM